MTADAIARPIDPDEPALVARPSLGARVAELLWVGGATPLLYPLSWLARRAFGLGPSELAIGFLTFHAAHVVNDPHFAVTYLLFYKHIKARLRGDAFQGTPRAVLVQRARYVLAGFVGPAALVAWAAYALDARRASAIGALVQLMFLLVGWHYVKQGFGVMSVLAARRGVRFSSVERGALLAHCYAAWAFAWANPFDPGHEVEEKGVVYTTLAHPVWLEPATLALCLVSLVVAIAFLVRKRLREGPLGIGTPLVALVASVWAWSILSSVDPLVRYVVPALHSIQYGYFVKLLKENEAKEREGPPWFEAASRSRLALLAAAAIALAWVLFHGVPDTLDWLLVPKTLGPYASPLGRTPFFATIYAVINIHHYLMDAVIWRRETPETRYLVARS